MGKLFENLDIIFYPLMVGILLSITAAVLGVVLVLKRYSMIGDTLSHSSFAGVAIGLVAGTNPIITSFKLWGFRNLNGFISSY